MVMEIPIKPAEQETVAGFQNMVETFPFYKIFPWNIYKIFNCYCSWPQT